MSGLEVVATGMTGLVARATAVLCLALALAWLARRGSARTLHLLWTTTFVVLLALPVVSLVGPSWPVPILPVRDANADAPSLEMTAEETSASGVERKMPASPISSESPSRIARSRTSSGSLAFESELLPPVASDYSAPLSPSTIAFLIWALGCGAALTSLAVGGFRFRKLAHRAVPVRDPDWLSQADSIRRRVCIRSDVRILLSTEAGYSDDRWPSPARDRAPVFGRRLDAGSPRGCPDPRVGACPPTRRAPASAGPRRGGLLLVSSPGLAGFPPFGERRRAVL